MSIRTAHVEIFSLPRCPVCRATIPGWDGKGGGVIGLTRKASAILTLQVKHEFVYDLKQTLLLIEFDRRACCSRILQTAINKRGRFVKLRLSTTAMSVLFETSLGDIVIDLEVDACPKTCENFLKLCKVYYYNLNAFFNGKFQTLNVSYFRLN